MTENNIDEKLIERFFEANSLPEIENRGFSRSVMRRIPQSRIKCLNTLWMMLCTVAMVIYLYVHQGMKVLFVALTHLWNSLSTSFVMPEPNLTTAIWVYVGIVSAVVFGVYQVLISDKKFI